MRTFTRLFGDGKHGQAERIQTFRGPACQTTCSSRRNTPLYHLKTPSHHVALVRISRWPKNWIPRRPRGSQGFRHATITTWLSRAARACAHPPRALLPPSPPAALAVGRAAYPAPLRSTGASCCGWPSTLAPKFCPRSIWVRAPNTWHTCSSIPCERSWPPFCIPLFTSDGLNLYFYALTAHFGHWREVSRRGRNVNQWLVAAGLIYGQVKKSYRRRKLVRVTHVMRLGTEAALAAALLGLGFTGRLTTAFIERVNLTVRHGVAALARRTWATSQQASQLLAHLEWWRAYSHFVRPHASLREALAQPGERGGNLLAQRYRQWTPAMAAGRTTRRWTAREVLSCPLPKVSA